MWRGESGPYMKDEKIVKVNFVNSEGRMKLKTKGKNATENALKIMECFDRACKEIRESENERKE